MKINKKILSQINNGGTTYGPVLDKDYAGTHNIAVSPFPERSQILIGKVTKKIVENYLKRNRDLFLKNFALGAWFDKNSLKTYLDIAVPVSLKKQTEAVALGRRANQIAGFNLFNSSEVPIGGTGVFNSIVTPFQERLKEALTLIK